MTIKTTVETTADAVPAVTRCQKGPVDGRYWPERKEADDELRSICYERAHEIYGDELPGAVQSRLDRELDAITGNGFTLIYYTAMELARKARENGSPVGLRGAGGSSLAAFLTRITEINPLPPHYVCPDCRHYEEPDSQDYSETGWDLPEKKCPVCGSRMNRDGYSIPEEGLFGLHMDRQPHLDLTVAESFGNSTAAHLKELFDDCCIYMTHPDVMDADGNEATASYVVLPEEFNILDFSPLEEPSLSLNYEETDLSRYELDEQLFIQDITESSSLYLLGKFTELTGEKLSGIPLDSGLVRELYVSDSPFTNAIFIRLSAITGSSWKKDTAEVRNMLKTLNVQSVGDYIRAAAMVDGTGTWNSFVKELIENKVCSIREIITTREDILNCLTGRGMSTEDAYTIMRRVSLGRQLTSEQINLMKQFKVPDWYIESCGYINYLMPRARACARAVNSTEIAWYLVGHLNHFREVWEEYQWEQFA